MRKGFLKLYGEIWQWGYNSARSFIDRLTALDTQGFDVIDLHLHSQGGEVLEGVAISNAIKACKTPIDCYIDGVAASMATIVMLACRNVYMADNAFLMIHTPSGGCYGTADAMTKTAKALKAMESNFSREYAKHTGRPESDIKKWLDGGDNWFSATQAQTEKLITGIFDAVDSSVQLPPKDEIQTNTATMMYQRYAALNTANNNKTNPQNSKKNMDKQAIIARYGLTSVNAESTEEQIYVAIDDKLKAEATARANAESALSTEKETQVTTMVDAAIVSKKITAEQRTAFINIGTKAGIDSLQASLNVKPAVGTFTNMLNQGGAQGSNADTARANWTWDDYQEKDAKALVALEKSDKEAFAALYNAKYKK